uniref:ATP synthase F0 subunit 6 n=1 Tax=Wellcomia compar TaxID=2744580 RepID=A0A8F7GPN9_9BILA|nr:ATP synthase F0 subunit 6 [Wellcomia compar]
MINYFFFRLIVVFWFSQFCFCFLMNMLSVFVRIILDFVMGVYGMGVDKVLSGLTGSVFFFFVLIFCYTGHFSWGLGLARSMDFIFYWAVICWFLSFLILSMEEILSNVFSLNHESLVGVFYSLFSKVCSVLVRPLSLYLRLLINISLGHMIIFFLFVFFGGVSGFFIGQFFVFVYNLYEFFLFILQSFVFSDLLIVYLNE